MVTKQLFIRIVKHMRPYALIWPLFHLFVFVISDHAESYVLSPLIVRNIQWTTLVQAYQQRLQQPSLCLRPQVQALGHVAALLHECGVSAPHHDAVQDDVQALGGKNGVHGGYVLTGCIGLALQASSSGHRPQPTRQALTTDMLIDFGSSRRCTVEQSSL
jgi:hypothetical protein